MWSERDLTVADVVEGLGSERDLTVADVREGPPVECNSGQGLRLSLWTRNGPAGMSSLLFT